MARTRYASMIVLGGLAVCSQAVRAQVPIERQFKFLQSTLSPAVRDDVRLLVPDGEGFRIYHEGASAFVCIADAPGDNLLSMKCFHRSIGDFLDLQRLLGKRGLTGDAFLEQVCAEVARGVVAVPNRAYVLEASATLPKSGGAPDSITMYHLIQLPYATEQSLGLTSEELTPGTPWIHHAGTCDAHVMWSEIRPFPPR